MDYRRGFICSNEVPPAFVFAYVLAEIQTIEGIHEKKSIALSAVLEVKIVDLQMIKDTNLCTYVYYSLFSSLSSLFICLLYL